MRKLVILGFGGFGREVAWLVEEINSSKESLELLGIIDEDYSKHGLIQNDCKVLGDFNYVSTISEQLYAVCAVGNPRVKQRLVRKAETAGLKFVNLIHPGAKISRYVDIGVGNIICAGSLISTNVTLKNHVCVNPSSNVGHDCVIESYSTILWSVNISGNCNIETGCEIGTNATIIQGVTVGSWSVIGAGSVVVKDIPSNCTVVGVPGKPIKFHNV